MYLVCGALSIRIPSFLRGTASIVLFAIVPWDYLIYTITKTLERDQ
jgi:hypothetical protein